MRNKLAIIPQDAFLFGGTVRDNIDPTGSRTDAELNDALNLIHGKSDVSSSLRDKFRLDANVQNEGANYSAGERQLRKLTFVPLSSSSRTDHVIVSRAGQGSRKRM